MFDMYRKIRSRIMGRWLRDCVHAYGYGPPVKAAQRRVAVTLLTGEVRYYPTVNPLADPGREVESPEGIPERTSQ